MNSITRKFDHVLLGVGLSFTAGLLVSCSSAVDEHPIGVSSPGPAALVKMESEADAGDSSVAVRSRVHDKKQFAALQNESVSRDLVAATSVVRRATLMPAAEVVDLRQDQPNREKYQDIADNGIVLAENQSTSTFSIDVDTGAYSNVRRFLNGGALPPADAVRIEELINYFSYDYSVPDTQETPFSINTELAKSPWNENTHLLHVGLRGFSPSAEQRPAANLVFLIDVSGSMNDANKLGLLKSSIKMLVKELDANDSVSIAVYAGASGVVLEPTPGNKKHVITAALDKLSAGGSTNGEAGIKLAYSLAAENFNRDGINRVILATDGDFNVGVSNIESLKSLIENKRNNGVALTTLGFGQGNYNDHLMEQLADTGNGAYAYIDTLNEARKVLVDELDATLLTIAKDVKIQVEFNPLVVAEYRLIGYVNRHLANEDFNNDKIDAGEIGAGHTVTALYEIALVGSGGELNTPSRYGKLQGSADAVDEGHVTDTNIDKFAGEIAELRLRYKMPDSDTSKLVTRIVRLDNISDEPGDNFRFSAAVASFAQHLRGGKFLGNFDLSDTVALAQSARGEDRFGYRAEFMQLVKLAESLTPDRQSSNANKSADEFGNESGNEFGPGPKFGLPEKQEG